MNIVVIGHVCIDHNRSEHTSYTAAGSPALFISRVYAQFPSVQTTIIAPYGADMLPYLKNEKILPRTPSDNPTLVYENVSHGNTRVQHAHHADTAQPVHIDGDIQKTISEADVLFFAPLTPNYPLSYIKECTKHKKKSCLTVMLPQGYYRAIDETSGKVSLRNFSEAHRIVPYFDFVIVSNEDHPAMQETAMSWSQKTTVIVTQGDHGADIFGKNIRSHVKTEPVRVEDIVDSVGSGDIFSASLAYKYAQAKDIKKAVEFANKIARQCLFYPSNNLKIHLPEKN